MANENNLTMTNGGNAENARLTRRKMVQRLLAGAGAGAAWPLVSTSHPIYGLLANDAVLDEAEGLGDTNWKPAFLTSQQNKILTALAESIVPGSTRAHVSRFIDLLLSVDKPENQRKFVESLTVLNGGAQNRFGKSFPALNAEQMNAFLTAASTKAEKPRPSPTSAAQKQSALYAHFENLKGWISGAYYSSEVGMRELGWKGDYAFAEFPGCAHPEGHA